MKIQNMVRLNQSDKGFLQKGFFSEPTDLFFAIKYD